ncbi:MAG: tetratricopeptide repeat protein [Bacteroidales bacterium]|nr:tetratricopeptide repeat protein [Bacteroidales bacterium]
MFNLPDPKNSGDLAMVISKFRKLESGVSIYIEKNEFLDLIDYYITQDKIIKAIKVLDYAIEFFPSCFEMKLTEAQLLIETGLFTQATQKLKKLYIESPDDLGLLMLIGINYAKSGITNKSMMFFDKALAQLENDQKSPILYTISQTFIQAGRYDIASLYLTKAYQVNPKDDSIILDLAFCLERNEIFDKSKKLYSSYLKRNPFSKLAWYNLGVVLTKLEENEKAIEAFDFAIAIDPKFSSAMYNKANILLNLGLFKEAVNEFNNVVFLEKGNASAIFHRGLAYFNQSSYKNALADIKSSLKIQEDQPEAWFYLAKIYFKFNKICRTKKALYRALNLENLNSKYWELAAKVFLYEDNYKSADKAFMHAISFDPFVDKYWFEYSDHKKQIKDFSEAISILKMGKEFISNVFLLNLKLSSLHFLNKDNKNAIISFKEANKIDSQALSNFSKIHPNKKEIAFLTDNIKV